MKQSAERKQRFEKSHDAEVMVGQQAEDKRKNADAYIYCRKIVRNAVLSFFIGVVLHGLLIRG